MAHPSMTATATAVATMSRARAERALPVRPRLLIGEIVLGGRRADLDTLGGLGVRDEDLRRAWQAGAALRERPQEEPAELAARGPLLRRPGRAPGLQRHAPPPHPFDPLHP